MKYEQMCREILKLVGGRENITDCYNCMTRLRIILADVSKADADAIKKIEGVLGTNFVNSQLQVIIGPEVGTVCKEFCQISGIERAIEIKDEASEKEDSELVNKKPFRLRDIPNKILDTIANCIQPLLPIIICGSMFKLLYSLLGPTMLNVIAENSNLYILFKFVGDAPFYFFPILIGYTGAKYFKINIPLGMLMGAVLLHPTLTEIVTQGDPFTVYGIPMKLVEYSSSIVPIILCLWVMSYVEKFFQKIIPDMFKMMAVNLCTMLVMLPLGLCVLAPAGSIIGSAVANLILAIPQYMGPFGIAIVCFIWPLLVATGMHVPVVTLVIPALVALGEEGVVFVADSMQHFAAMGVAIAFAISAKNKQDKSLGISSFTAMFLGGVIEPTLFGIAFPNKKHLLSLMTGNAVAGLFAGFLSVKYNVLGASNILCILSYAPGGTRNLICAIIASVLAFSVSLILSLSIAKVRKKAKFKKNTVTNDVLSVGKGEVSDITTVNDEAFAGEMMGKGVSIILEEGKVYSPVNGIVQVAFPTGHAFGLCTENEIEVLIHIGINTVELDGEGFQTYVTQGQKVKAGDLLCEFDQEAIKTKGYDTTVMEIITNTADFTDVIKYTGNKKQDEVVLHVKK